MRTGFRCGSEDQTRIFQRSNLVLIEGRTTQNKMKRGKSIFHAKVVEAQASASLELLTSDYVGKGLFIAGDCETTHGMVESELLFRAPKQVLKFLMA